jgi:site-specific recombinase XerC
LAILLSSTAVEGWKLKVIGKGNRGRIVDVQTDVAAELSPYLASRGLERDPNRERNRGAYLIGQATDVATHAPWSSGAASTVDHNQCRHGV